MTKPAFVQLVQNPSFEKGNGLPTSWSGSKLTSNDKRVCNRAHSGSCSFLFVGTNKVKQLIQTITLTGGVGDSLKFNLWARSEVGNLCEANMTVFMLNGTQQERTIALDGGDYGWREYHAFLAVDQAYDSIKIVLECSGPGGKVWFDDVNMTLTYPP